MPKISKIFFSKMPEFSDVCAIYMPKISTSAVGRREHPAESPSRYIHLPEPEFKDGLVYIAAQQTDGSVVVPHNLTGNAETNAGAFLFGGEERHEDLLLSGDRNWRAVVGNVDNYLIILTHPGGDVDMFRAGLKSVFDEVDKDLGYLALVGVNHQVILFGAVFADGSAVGGKLAVEGDDTCHQFFQVNGLSYWPGYAGELSVCFYKLDKILGRVADSVQSGLYVQFAVPVFVHRF